MYVYKMLTGENPDALASWVVQKRTKDIELVKTLMGHANIAITDRYINTDLDSMKYKYSSAMRQYIIPLSEMAREYFYKGENKWH